MTLYKSDNARQIFMVTSSHPRQRRPGKRSKFSSVLKRTCDNGCAHPAATKTVGFYGAPGTACVLGRYIKSAM
nr:hypothetical protein CFP56_02808 [Quercus suber]